jgi:hypothetical protein
MVGPAVKVSLLWQKIRGTLDDATSYARMDAELRYVSFFSLSEDGLDCSGFLQAEG